MNNSHSLQRKLLLGYSAVASLLAITGIVFLVLYVGSQSRLRGLKKERDVMANNLATFRNMQISSGNTNLGGPERHTFASHSDGRIQEYAFTPPLVQSGTKDLLLIVYFHGMGSNVMEPFVSPKNTAITQGLAASQPAAAIASLSYRAPSSWLNDAALDDVNQNIRELLQRYPFSRIVLVGTSMGGVSALAYSYLAPPDIAAKLLGVISCESAGDLKKLFSTTSNLVKNGLIEGLGGTPDTVPLAYEKRSLLLNLPVLSPRLRFAIISASKDSLIKPQLQEDIVEGLKARNIAAKLITIDEQHGFPPATIYKQGLDFVMDNDIK
jgi:acetyl esterase/lipase